MGLLDLDLLLLSCGVLPVASVSPLTSSGVPEVGWSTQLLSDVLSDVSSAAALPVCDESSVFLSEVCVS